MQAASGTGLLPVFGYALLAALVIGGAGGAWFGYRWHKGAEAIEENAQLRKDLSDLTRVAKELRDRAVQSDIDYQTALREMGAIAAAREQDREKNRKQFESQRAAFAMLLDARPDLRRDRAGDDVLRHWRRSNARPGAEPATTAPAGEPDAAVPGPAAAKRRPLGRADRKPRRGDRAISRLPERNRKADRGNAAMAGHRMAVVLRGGRTHRCRGPGLCA